MEHRDSVSDSHPEIRADRPAPVKARAQLPSVNDSEVTLPQNPRVDANTAVGAWHVHLELHAEQVVELHRLGLARAALAWRAGMRGWQPVLVNGELRQAIAESRSAARSGARGVPPTPPSSRGASPRAARGESGRRIFTPARSRRAPTTLLLPRAAKGAASPLDMGAAPPPPTVRAPSTRTEPAPPPAPEPPEVGVPGSDTIPAAPPSWEPGAPPVDALLDRAALAPPRVPQLAEPFETVLPPSPAPAPEATSYAVPPYALPQYAAPEHVAPPYALPQYAAPEHVAPEYALPYAAPEYSAPRYALAEPESREPSRWLLLAAVAGVLLFAGIVALGVSVWRLAELVEARLGDVRREHQPPSAPSSAHAAAETMSAAGCAVTPAASASAERARASAVPAPISVEELPLVSSSALTASAETNAPEAERVEPRPEPNRSASGQRRDVTQRVVLAEERQTAAARQTPAAPPMPVQPERALVARVLAQASAAARSCGSGDQGRVAVTFAPSGVVRSVRLLKAFEDKAVSACVMRAMGRARLPAFSGESLTVKKSVSL